MRNKKAININGQDITVRELTMEEVDELLAAVKETRVLYPAEVMLDPEIPQEAVMMATGMTADQLTGDITPSELAEIWGAVAEVNGFLSKLMARLLVVSETMKAALSSAAPSAE
ncbi:MAG: hypothetical protein KJ630_17650 [Proteobacteria bacterium]|nr:hypothetical protein [Pseudomonadota bacterium]